MLFLMRTVKIIFNYFGLGRRRSKNFWEIFSAFYDSKLQDWSIMRSFTNSILLKLWKVHFSIEKYVKEKSHQLQTVIVFRILMVHKNKSASSGQRELVLNFLGLAYLPIGSGNINGTFFLLDGKWCKYMTTYLIPLSSDADRYT